MMIVASACTMLSCGILLLSPISHLVTGTSRRQVSKKWRSMSRSRYADRQTRDLRPNRLGKSHPGAYMCEQHTYTDPCAAVLILYPRIVCCSPTTVLKDRNEIGVQSVRARLCLADLQAPWTVPLIEMAAAISIDQYQHDFAINLDLDSEQHQRPTTS
jgi:hypothetical protein